MGPRKFGVWLAGAILLVAGNVPAVGGVRRIFVPDGGIAPQVALGPSGVVYLVFDKGQNAFFAKSKDSGRTFLRPLQLNSRAEPVLSLGERGAKIAVGGNETVHVVWMDPRNGRLQYTRSSNGGRTFSPPRNLRDPGAHLDEANIAADRTGDVLVVWLDSRLAPDPENPLSLPIFMTVSRDNGATFSQNERIEHHDPPIHACSCCALEAVAEGSGVFDVAFRGAYHNVRDEYVARVPVVASAGGVTLDRVADQDWYFQGCPMSGPFLEPVARSRRLWIAWMNRGRSYYAESADGGRDFGSPRPAETQKSGVENHPLVLVNRQGQIFFAWENGRQIRWQITDGAGRLMDGGDAGALPDRSKATGFVDGEGNFCLVF